MFSRLFNNKNRFHQKFTTRDLSLDLLSGWIEYVEENEENRGYPLSFIKETDGVGALQISFVTSEKDKDFDIHEHLESNKQHVTALKDYKLRDWTVYEYEESKEGNFMKSFNFVKPHVIAYATYTVASEHKRDKELNEALEIIKSLQIEESKKDDTKSSAEATFSFYNMKENGKKYLIRFMDDVSKYRNDKKYKYQIGIATPLISDNEGFPTKEENEQLINMELIIEKEFAEHNLAVLVGVIVGGGMKELVFYTGNPDESIALFEKLRGEIKHHELQCVIQEDPNWDIYSSYTTGKVTK